MTQLDPRRYLRLTKQIYAGRDDGLFYDTQTGEIVSVKNDTVYIVPLLIASQARGDILRRDASSWGRLDANNAGNVLMGDGTDIISQAISGDITLSGGGVATLASDKLVLATASFNAAAIVGTSAGQLGHASGGVVAAAPAAGFAAEFVAGVVILDFDTAAYTGGGNVSFNYAGGGGALSATVSFANSIGGSSDKVALVAPAVPTNNQLAAATGINLVVAAAPTQPGTAAGVVRARVLYRLHTTGL